MNRKNVRWASLRFSGLESLGFVEGWDRLECISVEGNQLRSLQPLSHHSALRAIYASKNLIETVDDVEQTPALERLHLCSNSIHSLGKWISKFPTLLELCRSLKGSWLMTHARMIPTRNEVVDDNQLRDTSDIYSLKHIPELLSLSLIGNPVGKTNQYKQFIIYHNPSIRV